ncbi:hypothetical protein LTS18_000511, partial [Coniosporium uncinatum]
ICAEDLGFHRSLDPQVATKLDEQNARLLSLASRLIGSGASGSAIRAPRLDEAEDVDGSWRSIVDVVDNLLERADTSLDEFSGQVRRLSPSQEAVAKTPTPRKGFGARNVAGHNIQKPQQLFEHVPTNTETDAWKPLLTSKPHAIVRLEESLRKIPSEHGDKYDTQFYLSHYKSTSPEARKLIDDQIRYQHPYQAEIEAYRYPNSLYTKADPIPYDPYDDTSATYVDTEKAVLEMLEELKSAKEIAIDLEHHDTHSYIGLVSLMQISTRNRDWIVDTLKPWRRRLECLNEVFADPNILKVGPATSIMVFPNSLTATGTARR